MTIEAVSTEPLNCVPRNLDFNFITAGGHWPTAVTYWDPTCLSVTNTGCGTFSNQGPTPVAILGLNTTYADTDPNVPLQGEPAGGTFTIDGLPATGFDPASLGAGDHDVIYTITDGASCTRADTLDGNCYWFCNL